MKSTKANRKTYYIDPCTEGGQSSGFCEARSSINWGAVRACPRYTYHYVSFERYRAAVRAQKSHYYRRRLAKLGINWRYVQKPYGTEAIELD